MPSKQMGATSWNGYGWNFYYFRIKDYVRCQLTQSHSYSFWRHTTWVQSRVSNLFLQDMPSILGDFALGKYWQRFMISL